MERYTRLDAETLSYFREVDAFVKTNYAQQSRSQIPAGDAPPIDDLIEKVFEEMRGREPEIICDAECSRIIESLLPHASPDKLEEFAQTCLRDDNLGLICTSYVFCIAECGMYQKEEFQGCVCCMCRGPFGSHVLETLLDTIVHVIVDYQRNRRGSEEETKLLAALEDFARIASENLFDMINSKYGSFVARRLVTILSGDVTDRNKAKNGTEVVDQKRSYSNSNKKNLAMKVERQDRVDTLLEPRVDLLQRMCKIFMSEDYTARDIHDLQTSRFAGPFLKVLLQAMGRVGEEQQRADIVICLLGGNPAVGPDSISSDSLYQLMTDRSGSHLVEAALVAAPDSLFGKLCTTGFKGRLPALAQHPSANFTVQAAISHVKKPQQLKRMYEDLRDSFVALLRGRRGGVITVLLAAAAKLNCLQAECATTLWNSLEKSFSKDEGQNKTPLHSLLTLDTTVELGASEGKLSALGCAAAVSLFQYPKGMTKEWIKALENLSPKEVSQIALDPGGCRVLESYLGHEDTTAQKRHELMGKIQGSWGAIACFGSGNKFVETCFITCTDASVKKQIAQELADAETKVAATHRGPALLATCKVRDIKVDEKNWEHRIQSAVETRKEFEELFGPGEKEKKAKKEKRKKDSGDEKKKKKKKKKEEGKG